MRFLTSIFLVCLFSAAASAAPQILNWVTKEISEADAVDAAEYGVKHYIEEIGSCELVNLWGFEAINHLKDVHANSLIVVSSIAEVQGSRCKLERYQDCNTVFAKKDGAWKYEHTTCDKEESAE